MSAQLVTLLEAPLDNVAHCLLGVRQERDLLRVRVRIRVRVGVRARVRVGVGPGHLWPVLHGAAPVLELQVLDDAREGAVRLLHLVEVRVRVRVRA